MQRYFNGGGLLLAENKIKQEEIKYQAQGDFYADPDLSALSCRWKPIPSSNGTILSLLVESKEGASEKVYKDFLTQLNEIFVGSLDKANPVHLKQHGDKKFFK